MGIVDCIGAGPVALDTAVFIYYIEENERFLPLVEPIFEAITAGRLAAMTSDLTLLEVLVIPYRARNNALAARYEALLTRSKGLTMVGISRDVLRVAAMLRATVAVKAPDALQLACALQGGATTFVTNDRRLPDVHGLQIVQLTDHLPPPAD